MLVVLLVNTYLNKEIYTYQINSEINIGTRQWWV